MLTIIWSLPCGQISRKEQSTQWEWMTHRDHSYCFTRLEPFKRRHVLASSLNEDDCTFDTGVSKTVFDHLAKAASAEATKTFLSLPTEDQLLLTLMRLRLGLLYGYLARMFQVSVTCAHNIFKHMLSVLTSIMKKIVIWLPRAVIRNSTPDSFIKNGFEGTTCIIDCSEIVLQRPKKLRPRPQTYSSYKARNTVKFFYGYCTERVHNVCLTGVWWACVGQVYHQRLWGRRLPWARGWGYGWSELHAQPKPQRSRR